MKIVRLCIGLGLFILGFVASSLLVNGNYVTTVKASPADNIDSSNIKVFKDKAVIEQPGLIYAKVKDTHSMEPVLNKHSTTIEKKPTTPDKLAVGDIISYSLDNKVIIHRIIKIGEDEQGWFAVLKGDNNPEPDRWKVRFGQVEGLVVGIVY